MIGPFRGLQRFREHIITYPIDITRGLQFYAFYVRVWGWGADRLLLGLYESS